MPALTTAQVWSEIEKQMFAVISFVNPRGHPRSAGVVYVTQDRCLFVATAAESWKARHLRANPHIAVTVTIARRIPFLPWIQIPAATICFHGAATVLGPEETDANVVHRLLRGHEDDTEPRPSTCIISITPTGSFATYGIGVGLREMRDRVKARGHVPVR
jgi:general stress protein 26